MKKSYIPLLKVVSATFLLVCFVSLKESTFETRKCFLFHFVSCFCSEDNQILTFQILKCHEKYGLETSSKDFQRIFYRKEFEEVCVLIWTNFDIVAKTY